MHPASDYQILLHGDGLTLSDQNNGTRMQRVSWTHDRHMDCRGDPEPMALLSYRVDLLQAQEFLLRVQLRDLSGLDRTISTASLSGDGPVHFMDPFPMRWIAVEGCSILFRALPGTRGGSATIRNIVTFFQRGTDSD